MAESSKTAPETHEFKAEIQQLLDILVHSVYTSKDIFIRELISNAADALEKLRFLKLQGGEIHDPDAPLEIRLETKEEGERKILALSDTGVGMTLDEVKENIGTIAHSGAAAFLEELSARTEAEKKKKKGSGKKKQATGENGEPADLSLIGRFGVGFYSVFMAADKVVLTTRSADPQARPVVWTSQGMGSYSVETLDEDAPRGTRIEVHLKKEEERFAEEETVRSAVRKYSNFVSFPILLNGEQINKTKALWREPPSQIKDEEYNEFFKYVTHDFQDPLLRLHLSVDVPFQFSALLFVPRTSTEVLGFGEGEVSLQLYVKRVLIDPENRDLLPKYLRFVKGVVESEDLPLNISRETLQENALILKIRQTLTRKVLDLLLDTAQKDPEKYGEVWRTFGRIIKEGHADFSNREKFQDLLRFNSSRHEDDKGLTSLAEYVEAMPGAQKAIYYLSGASREALERDPRLEIFRKRGIEVLYLLDIADEFVIGTLGKYKDTALLSADKVKLEDLEGVGKKAEGEAKEEEKEAEESKKETADPAALERLIGRFKETLGERVTDVRTSERLVDSPACLVSDDPEMSGHMEKVLRLMNKDADLPKRALELNPSHPLIRGLAAIVENDPNDPLVEPACEQLFEGSMLVDGYLTDPHRLVERMNRVLEDAVEMKRVREG